MKRKLAKRAVGVALAAVMPGPVLFAVMLFFSNVDMKLLFSMAASFSREESRIAWGPPTLSFGNAFLSFVANDS